jgi:hypothetical protein
MLRPAPLTDKKTSNLNFLSPTSNNNTTRPKKYPIFTTSQAKYYALDLQPPTFKGFRENYLSR